MCSISVTCIRRNKFPNNKSSRYWDGPKYECVDSHMANGGYWLSFCLVTGIQPSLQTCCSLKYATGYVFLRAKRVVFFTHEAHLCPVTKSVFASSNTISWRPFGGVAPHGCKMCPISISGVSHKELLIDCWLPKNQLQIFHAYSGQVERF